MFAFFNLIFGDNACHPEHIRFAQCKLREGSGSPDTEILRCAQDDSQDTSQIRSREEERGWGSPPDPRQGASPPAPLFYELISVFDVLPNGSLWCMLRYNYGSMFSRVIFMQPEKVETRNA